MVVIHFKSSFHILIFGYSICWGNYKLQCIIYGNQNMLLGQSSTFIYFSVGKIHGDSIVMHHLWHTEMKELWFCFFTSCVTFSGQNEIVGRRLRSSILFQFPPIFLKKMLLFRRKQFWSPHKFTWSLFFHQILILRSIIKQPKGVFTAQRCLLMGTYVYGEFHFLLLFYSIQRNFNN